MGVSGGVQVLVRSADPSGECASEGPSVRIRPDGERLVATVVGMVLLGVVVLGMLFTAMQIVTGQLNTADILHRLPKPVAAVFVEDPDEAMMLDCDDLDETDPAAVERYAGEHGLAVEYVPAGEEPASLAGVEWVYWRDRLVAYADGVAPPAPGGGSSCPG